MPVQWERLAGDTSRFAIRLAFAPDPDGGRAATPELACSWGSFQLWVDGRNLCAHSEEGERIESVHWYLLPLMEWFARNWNPLLHEERLPAKNEGGNAWASLRSTRFPPAALAMDADLEAAWQERWQGWWSRHALRAASDGGLFPDVIFRRLRDAVEISWGDVPSAGMPAGFDFLECSQRAVRLAPAEIAAPLHEALSSACSHLVSGAAESERIRELVRTLRALRRVGQRQKRLGWLAGLGTDENSIHRGFVRTKRWLSGVRGTRPLLDARFDALVVEGSCHAALMFGCLAPDVRREDVVRLAEIMAQSSQQSMAEDDPELQQFQQAVAVDESDARPWAQGYELAEDFIERFGPRPSHTHMPVDIYGILADLGVEVVEAQLTDETIRGVAIAGPRRQPCVAWNSVCERNMDEKGRRFTLAHELCHLLFDADAGRSLALASGPWAPVAVEQRANAFAAMLLMPTDVVHAAIADLTEPLDSAQAVSRLADQFNMGFYATLWHLENLGFIDDYTRRRIAVPSGSLMSGAAFDWRAHEAKRQSLRELRADLMAERGR